MGDVLLSRACHVHCQRCARSLGTSGQSTDVPAQPAKRGAAALPKDTGGTSWHLALGLETLAACRPSRFITQRGAKGLTAAGVKAGKTCGGVGGSIATSTATRCRDREGAPSKIETRLCWVLRCAGKAPSSLPKPACMHAVVPSLACRTPCTHPSRTQQRYSDTANTQLHGTAVRPQRGAILAGVRSKRRHCALPRTTMATGRKPRVRRLVCRRARRHARKLTVHAVAGPDLLQ